MNDRLTAACIRELEHAVEMQFAAARALPGTGDFLTTPFVTIPVIGGKFFAGWEPLHLRQQVVAALIAREQFRLNAPPWAPELPLKSEDCALLENADSPRLNLVGCFGTSLRYGCWDYLQHPCFADFCSGLLANEHAPDYLRNDAGLLQEFPPHVLEGLGDELVWRSPVTIASQRAYQAQCAAAMARMERMD